MQVVKCGISNCLNMVIDPDPNTDEKAFCRACVETGEDLAAIEFDDDVPTTPLLRVLQ